MSTEEYVVKLEYEYGLPIAAHYGPDLGLSTLDYSEWILATNGRVKGRVFKKDEKGNRIEVPQTLQQEYQRGAQMPPEIRAKLEQALNDELRQLQAARAVRQQA